MVAQGITPTQIRVLTAGSTGAGSDAKSDSDDVPKDLLRDGAIGTAVGTAAGAGVSIAMAAANLTLFIAIPVLGALYLIGWGASLGGLVGAVVGSERSKGDASTLMSGIDCKPGRLALDAVPLRPDVQVHGEVGPHRVRRRGAAGGRRAGSAGAVVAHG